MPNRDSASINSALNTILAPRITTQINRACMLAQVLSTVPARNKNVAWDVQLGTDVGTAAARAEDADIAAYSVDTKIPATLNFAHLSDAITVSQFAQDIAARTGPEALADLWMSESKDAIQRLAKLSNKGLWLGTGAANNVHGLLSTGGVQPIADAGIYAGIDPATHTQWVGNVVTMDGGGGARAALSFTAIRSLRRKILNACGIRPNMYVCNPLQFDYFGALFDSNRRFEQTTEIVVGGRKIQLDGGFTAGTFEGAPVLWDSDCPVDVFVALHTDYVDIEAVFPVANPTGNRMATGTLSGSSTEISSGQTGIVCSLKKLAEAGNYSRMGVFTDFQLAVRRRQACGVINNLLNT